jgi:Putative Tad-like Flp pilus-assembly
MLYSGIGMTALFGMCVLTLDLGRARSAKGELQAAADAAALNAANGLADGTFAAKAVAAAGENKVDGTPVAPTWLTTTPGNWSNDAFTANANPRNAVRVQIERSAAKNNKLSGILVQGLGLTMPDVKAVGTVALINQAPYEWVGLDNTNLTASNNAFKVSSYDATNPGAGEARTTIQSNGNVTVNGPATINAHLKYGNNAQVDPAATVLGAVTQSNATTYPPGSQVANLTGVTPVYSTTYDLNVNSAMTLPGGVYVVKNCNVTNASLTFTGPATIVLTGNLNMSGVSIFTPGNRPSNLKFIATVPGTSINITNPAATIYADFYAPGSTFNYTSAAGAKDVRGRGVFKTLTASGAGASLWYDRSLTAASLSKKAVLVH